MRRALAVAVAAAAVGVATPVAPKIEIDPMKDDFPEVMANKVDSAIANNRELGVAAIWYYKDTRLDAGFKDTYNEVAKKLKGMIKMIAMDCDKGGNKKACGSITFDGSKPAVEIYPPLPMPKFAYAGEATAEKLERTLTKQIPGDKISMITTVEEYKTFTKKNPTKPKVFLFWDKKKPVPVLKGLSTEIVFARTVEFAYVDTTAATDVATESGAAKKKLPAILLINKGKKEWYTDKDKSFAALQVWINRYSESGMGDTVKGGDTATEIEMEEPEYERLRELKDRSQKELCFGQKNVCGVLLSEGKPSEKDIDSMLAFETKFQTKSDRGVSFNWMWLDMSIETDFKKAIEDMEPRQAEKEDRDAETIKYPTLIFVKPPKKKREEKLLSYTKIANGEAIEEKVVGDMVDRIAGGATYVRADLPKFVNRKALAKKAKKEEL